MVEALSIILLFGFLAACIASIIGVVIGFRRKEWLLAIITGSATGVLFILFVIAASFADFEESTGPTPEQAVSPPTIPSAPIPAVEPSPTATAEPTPTPIPNLGIKRAEVQKRFERLLRDQGITFEPTISTDGNPTMMGLTEDDRIGVALQGSDDELTYAAVLVNMGGYMSDDDIKAATGTLRLLPELIVPQWDRNKWIRIGLTAADKVGTANIEQVHDGKLIKFAFAPSTEVVLLSIEPEPEVMPEAMPEPKPAPAEQPSTLPTPAPVLEPIAQGIGFTRGQFSRRLGEFGYVFGTQEYCPEICTTWRVDVGSKAVFWLYGPHANLEYVTLKGNVVNASEDTGVAIADLLHIIMPDHSDEVRAWLRTDVLDLVASAGGNSVRDSLTVGDKQVEVEVDGVTGQLLLTIRPAR